jgi:mannose-6-phosphate isomerase-like protein (cupin superfamily)
MQSKPWGSYQVLDAGAGYQVKRVEVEPGLRLSLQKHARRAEKWTVVSGQGLVTLGAKSVPVKAGSCIEIPAGELHRIQNTGTARLVFIEVQLGDYLGEDDIVRVEDDFNRAKKQ